MNATAEIAGPGDRMVLGYSRAWVVAAACAAMLAIAGTQYGFGAFAVRLGTARHGVPVAAGFAAWLACQAAAGGALSWGRRRLSVSPARTATFGTACCALGLLLMATITDPAGALAVYAVIGGIGAGLGYGTCRAVIASWFPAAHAPAALVSGAFCLAAILVALAAAAMGGPVPPLGVLAWAAMAVTALCAPLLSLNHTRSLSRTRETRRNR